MKPPAFRPVPLALLAFCLADIGDAQAAFTISSCTPINGSSNGYRVTGTGLSSVSSVVGTAYNPGFNESNPFAFGISSDTELQFYAPRSVSAYTALTFSGASYIDIEINYSVFSLSGTQVVGQGQTANNTANNSTLLVQSGGTLTSLGPSSTLVYVQAGGTYVGPGSGSNNRIYSVAGANITNTGGGSSNSFQVVNSINQLPFVVPEPSTWAMLAAGMGLLGVGVLRRRGA